ncbi:MAG: hypothetical protein NTZ48_05605 [Candidatus Omnitrophica bacterium]|nr:hypothetical protein [Candidatus Omnitrophota bacterium]
MDGSIFYQDELLWTPQDFWVMSSDELIFTALHLRTGYLIWAVPEGPKSNTRWTAYAAVNDFSTEPDKFQLGCTSFFEAISEAFYLAVEANHGAPTI